MCLLPSRELDCPLVQRLAANTERLLHALVRPGDVTVERHSDRDPRFAHWSLVERNLLWRRTRPPKIDTSEGQATTLLRSADDERRFFSRSNHRDDAANESTI